MPATRHATYDAALGELRMIRDQLESGRAGPAEVEALTRRAATELTEAREALKRGHSAVEALEAATAANPAAAHDPMGSAT